MLTPKDRRFKKTIAFAKKHLPEDASLLDLGTPNPLSELLNTSGFSVQSTKGENLDTDYERFLAPNVDCITAFEIFEHMLAPFNILSRIKCDKLIASVPLKLWFASAYWNEKDDWDKHYHEFEKKQFDYLLKHSGWQIKDSLTWASPDYSKMGIRPLLRYITPRYYMVYCERVK